jgi:hypothetical protein
MQILDVLTQAVKASARVLKWGAGLQEGTRRGLIADLQAICANCETAYDAVLTRLVPVKNAFADPSALAGELRSFAADRATRDAFKPDHLCGQVDHLLSRLASNLDPLKYAIDVRRIAQFRQSLQQFGNVDGAIYQAYDDLVRDLDRIATELQNPATDRAERAQYARHVIDEFEDDLRSARAAMFQAKSDTIGLI